MRGCRPRAICCDAFISSTRGGSALREPPARRPRLRRRSDAMSTDPRHDSAHLHVSGRALYTDDMALPPDTLHAAFGTSGIAHGRLRAVDLAPLLALPGVVAAATAEDVPG